MAELNEPQQAAIQRMAAHAAELPVRQPMPGEQALMDVFIDAHGDPASWEAKTSRAYAAEVAQLRADTLRDGTQ
ncbi:hypothetical protein [Kitasatospora sp. NPDC056181]|uniref:hypothetical protein n=1 Tax=Kitasatospora sp. NPDC056181 TaxID=3345737 RepID=UPI0035DE037E